MCQQKLVRPAGGTSLPRPWPGSPPRPEPGPHPGPISLCAKDPSPPRTTAPRGNAIVSFRTGRERVLTEAGPPRRGHTSPLWRKHLTSLVPRADAGPARHGARARVTPRATSLVRRRPKSASPRPTTPPLTPSSLTVRRPAVRPFSLTYRFLPTS